MVESTGSSSRTDIPRPDIISATRHPLTDVESSQSRDITTLLHRWRKGDGSALQELLPKVYDHLHRLAVVAMNGERANHTLQATALVNEAYLRLQRNEAPDWQDRAHFFAISARLMRRILVDHARAAGAVRRGGGTPPVQLDDVAEVDAGSPADLLALDQALAALGKLRPRQARILELRFFAGLSVAETAEVLSVSVPTVILDTRLGRAWLFARLRRYPGSGPSPADPCPAGPSPANPCPDTPLN